MIIRRLSAALVALPLAVSLAACGSDSVSGSGASASASSGTSSSSTSSASSSSSSASSGSNEVDELLSKLRSGVSSVTSVHLAATSKASGQTAQIDGDETLDGGKLKAADVRASVSGQQLELRIVTGRIWAKLPGVGTTAKPWALITTSSPNPNVKALAQVLSSLTSNFGLDQSVQFLSANASARKVGTSEIGGSTATHYALVVDYRKLPASFPNKKLIIAAGLTTAPVDIYVDDKGRPVRIDTKVTLSGRTTTSSILFTKYNEPVSIVPPPASQVTTG